MGKIVVEGVELQFNDLSEQAQEKLYLQKKEFEKDVAKSQYADIRRILINDEKTSSDTLDEIFKVETEIYGNVQNIKLLWNHPNFERNDKKLKVLASSDYWKNRLEAAKYEGEGTSSEFLNEMLQNELQGKQNGDVIRTILNNLKFQMEEETLKGLAASDDWELRIIAAKYEGEGTSSEFLNEMLRNELQGEQDSDVIAAILNNLKFQMKEETLKVLAASDDWENRLEAAKYEGEGTSSEFLNEMLQNELQGEQDGDVIGAILNNLKFQMKEETLKVLASSDYWKNRLRAAKYEGEGTSSEFLNEMFRSEIQGQGDDAVEKAILNNLKFQMEEKTWKILAKSGYDYRIIAAKEKLASSDSLQEMYLTETDEDVLEAIELNMLQKISKTSTKLNVIQERQLLNVLKELKHSKKKWPLSKYLKQILEIIG